MSKLEHASTRDWLFSRGRSRGAMLAALVAIVAFTATFARAQGPLTLAEAQRRAVERSRMLAGQDSAVTASREMAVAAGQFPDPVLKLEVNDLPVNGPDRFSLVRD